MRKTLALCLVALSCAMNVSAQVEKFGICDHLGAGLSVGTDGIGIEVATTLTDYVAVRAGMSIVPRFKYGFDVSTYGSSVVTTDEVRAEGKLNKTDFKLLFDIYPFRSSSFRVTTGAYIGSSKIISVYNTEPFLNPTDWGKAGIVLGDYRITSDQQGNVSADIKVSGFKPYVGIGFGRAVPRKRLGFSFDLGVQFWGKPGVYTTTKDEFGDSYYRKLTKEEVDNDDADKFFDIMSKIRVYPVLSFRLAGRIL